MFILKINIFYRKKIGLRKEFKVVEVENNKNIIAVKGKKYNFKIKEKKKYT